MPIPVTSLSTPVSPHRLRANGLLLLTAAIWGFAFTAQRVGAEHVGPFSFNAVRFALGALVLLPLIRILDRRPGRRGTGSAAMSWRATMAPGLVAGTVLFVGAFLQQQGIETTTAGKAAFVTGLYVVLVPLLGIILRHRTTAGTWVGVAFAVVGLYLLCVTEDLTIATGDALMLLGAVAFAGHILVIDRYGALDPVRLSVVQFLTCAGLSLIAALGFEPTPLAGLDRAVVPILYGGLLSVGVAYTLQVVAQRDALPSHAALLLALESVFGVLGGALLLGESMTARGYVGCVLMFVGIVASQLGPARAPAVPAP